MLSTELGAGQMRCVMAKCILANAAENFELFRSMMHNDIPEAYHQWLNLVFQMTTDAIGGAITPDRLR
jgi:hypothetical protein